MNSNPIDPERPHHGANGGSQNEVGIAGNGERPGTIADVCLLDDDPCVLKATGRLLCAAGFEVKTFSDPHALLEHAHRNHPRVAVIDIMMPVMNGLEVQTRLRKIAPNTRVIVLTSKNDPIVRARAIEGGASAFFLKPADDEEFVSCIRSQLNGN